MNKQEKEDLIQALYDIGGCEAEDEWARGYDDGVNAAIEFIKELEVQEKAIVPKLVAIELDKLKDKYLTLRDLYDGDVNWLNNGTFYLEGKELELAKYVNENETIFEYAWIHGYEVEEELAIHELKILPEYFEAVVSGDKRFEIRKNDRNYQKGDILRLNEYQDGQYTGRFHVVEITYITDYAQQDGYVVLGIK
ncbi:ASCH/PUA domain-containing protein [Enterococcus sp. C54]|uniref:ASCH/PUA domain-containing protein n=1 Tax=Enterococcus sp. C54 TaxID=3231315 RepID=UPI00349FD91D